MYSTILLGHHARSRNYINYLKKTDIEFNDYSEAKDTRY